MAEPLVAVGEIGPKTYKVEVYDLAMDRVDVQNGHTQLHNYDNTLKRINADAQMLAMRRGEIVAASFAIAAAVNSEGVITQAGIMHQWADEQRPLRADLESVLDMSTGSVSVLNDVVATAISQQAVNAEHGNEATGIAVTWSRGLGAATYNSGGLPVGEEIGHEFLRGKAHCPCGGEGHAEAYVSEMGLRFNNRTTSLEDLLEREASVRRQLVVDLTETIAKQVKGHRRNRGDNFPDEIRWTGTLASQHPLVLRRVSNALREIFGDTTPNMEAITAGKGSVIHGAYIDARRRAS